MGATDKYTASEELLFGFNHVHKKSSGAFSYRYSTALVNCHQTQIPFLEGYVHVVLGYWRVSYALVRRKAYHCQKWQHHITVFKNDWSIYCLVTAWICKVNNSWISQVCTITENNAYLLLSTANLLFTLHSMYWSVCVMNNLMLMVTPVCCLLMNYLLTFLAISDLK